MKIADGLTEKISLTGADRLTETSQLCPQRSSLGLD
jgi:hypothetical protein